MTPEIEQIIAAAHLPPLASAHIRMRAHTPEAAKLMADMYVKALASDDETKPQPQTK